MKMTWCSLKITENYHVLVNQFQGNFRSKTLSCRKIKYIFRDVKWCLNASCGLKGLTQFDRLCFCMYFSKSSLLFTMYLNVNDMNECLNGAIYATFLVIQPKWTRTNSWTWQYKLDGNTLQTLDSKREPRRYLAMLGQVAVNITYMYLRKNGGKYFINFKHKYQERRTSRGS